MDGKRIMVVEDEAIIALNIARQLTELGYAVVDTSYSGEEALGKIQDVNPDLVLMDIVLSGKMDGIEAAKQIKSLADIPAVYLTSYADEKTFSRAKFTNPNGYILKPFDKKQLYVAIELALQKHVIERDLKKNHAVLQKIFLATIKAIAQTIEQRGPYTSGHHERTSRLALAIAGEMGLTNYQQEGIELASAIYDIGLVNIPAEIIRESGRLDGLRRDIYQTYPMVAYETLKKIEFLWPIADIILQHRESYDGSGFPQGLRGDDILMEARILAVAVAIEDMTTRMSWRDALPIKKVLEEISTQSGSKYDPRVGDACLKLFREKGYKLEGGICLIVSNRCNRRNRQRQ